MPGAAPKSLSRPFSTAFLLVGLTLAVGGAERGAPAGESVSATPPLLSQNGSRAAESAGGPAVYLMTMEPGDRVWERFGHNAIWIVDEEAGLDEAYNYGLFDFDQENFLLRLIRGRMLYWVDAFPGEWTVSAYAADNRTVRVQRLNLSETQRTTLHEFLAWNALPENRFYRYDYFRDNCSTRVRDALDLVLGGALRRQLIGQETGTTYRSHSERLTAGLLPASLGLTLAFGPAADRQLSAWEESFIPMKLAEHVARATVAGPDGGTMPLVASEQTLFSADRQPPPDEAPNRTPWLLLIGLIVGAAVVALSYRAAESRNARAALAVLGAGWGLLAGLLGSILLGLWAFTEHVFTYGNENLLQVSPLALVFVVLIPAAVFGRRRALWMAVGAAIVVAGLSVLGLVLQVVPRFDQANGEIIALALPIQLGLAWALWRIGSRPRGESDI